MAKTMKLGNGFLFLVKKNVFLNAFLESHEFLYLFSPAHSLLTPLPFPSLVLFSHSGLLFFSASFSPSFSFHISHSLFSPTPLSLPFFFILIVPHPPSLHPSKFSHSTTFFIGLLQGLSVALQPLSSKEAKKSPTRKHVLKELRAASSPFTPDRLDEVGT